MDKMMVVVFETEEAAFNGTSALKDLHRSGDVSLYATAVIAKDGEGQIATKQAAEDGPIGTPIGLLTGGLIGLLAGPAGMLVGASLGGLTGLIVDINKSGVDLEFLREVGEVMSPGRTALVANLDEGWTIPVDTRMAEQGGMVFRRLRSEVIEDQLARESAEMKAEIAQLKAEWAEASDEAKAAIQSRIDTLKSKIETSKALAESRLEETKSEIDAKLTALEEQMSEAADKQKAKLEKRSAELKADLASRSEKLQRAAKLAAEALTA